MKFRLQTLAVVLAMVVAIPAFAGNIILMDYTGFAWETGGVPVSNPGDILNLAAVAVQYDAAFGVAPGSQEVTILIYDLSSTGQFIDPWGNIRISYAGGHIEVYEDALLNHDWGTNPPNPLGGTFTDGQLLFEGDFTDFFLTLTASGLGSYDGTIDGVGGTAAQICDGVVDCAYTFGGAFSRPIAQIPDGYDLQVDGTLEVDAAVPTHQVSFSAVKALYH